MKAKTPRVRIDKGVPLPPTQPRYGDALRKLQVHEGEDSKSSFAVSNPDQWQRLRSAVSNAQRDTPMRFMTRKVRERDSRSGMVVDVLRVWRTK